MLDRLFNRTQRRMISYLTESGERSLPDITEWMSLSKPTVSRQLKDMVDLGVVSERVEKTETGRTAVYSLNRFTYVLILNPSARAVLSIQSRSEFEPQFLLLEQLKEDEFKDDMRRLLGAIHRLKRGKRPISLILFGSVAVDKGTWKSDIDIAVIGLDWDKTRKDSIDKLISDVNMETKHQIKAHYIEKLQLLGEESLLVKEVKTTGLVIYADIFERAEIWKQMMRYKSIVK